MKAADLRSDSCTGMISPRLDLELVSIDVESYNHLAHPGLKRITRGATSLLPIFGVSGDVSPTERKEILHM
jgi:hypothetical protein